MPISFQMTIDRVAVLLVDARGIDLDLARDPPIGRLLDAGRSYSRGCGVASVAHRMRPRHEG
jgi:hypothetical protein